MEAIRSYFSFFLSYFQAIEELPMKYQCPVYRAICRYSLFGIEDDALQGVPKAIFLSLKPALDKNRIKSENASGSISKKAKEQQIISGRLTITQQSESGLEANDKRNGNEGVPNAIPNGKIEGYNKEYRIENNNSKPLLANTKRKGNKNDTILKDDSVSKYVNDEKW